MDPAPAGWMSVFLLRHRCFVGDAQLHFVADVRHEHAQVEVDALDRGSRVEACRRTDVLLKVVWGKFPVSKKQALRRCSSKSATCEDSPASGNTTRSEEHTSELQSLMRISYAVFCLKKKTTKYTQTHDKQTT